MKKDNTKKQLFISWKLIGTLSIALMLFSLDGSFKQGTFTLGLFLIFMLAFPYITFLWILTMLYEFSKRESITEVTQNRIQKLIRIVNIIGSVIYFIAVFLLYLGSRHM